MVKHITEILEKDGQLAFIKPKPREPEWLSTFEEADGIPCDGTRLEQIVDDELTLRQRGTNVTNQPTPPVGNAIVNDEIGYGVTEINLISFNFPRSRQLGFPSSTLYYGTSDFFRIGIDTAHRIFQQMNTADIVAFLMGYSLIKGNGWVTIGNFKSIPYESLLNATASECISKLVQAGHQFPCVRAIQEKGFSGHPTGPNALKNRIKEIPADIQAAFMENFRRSPRVSNLQNRRRFDFYDMNRTPGEYIEHVSGVMRYSSTNAK